MNRSKLVSAALTVSLLLNAGAVFLLIKLIKVRESYHRLSAEIKASSRIARLVFVSLEDGASDAIAVLPPEKPGGLDHTLLVYLHGMGSNEMEPFIYPKGSVMATAFSQRWPKLCVLGCDYRGLAAWGNDKAMADVSQNIREVEQQFPIKRIVLMGSSMGGGSALTYALEAPSDIKSKIVGVACLEGTGDLTELYKTTHSPQIQEALQTAFGGTPEQKPEIYQRKSFVLNAEKLPPNVRVAVVSALKDDIVPPPLQTKIVEALKRTHHPVHLITVNTPHAVPPVDVYIECLAFALGQD